MARLSIEGFTDHFDRELRKALDATLREHFPDQNFNSRVVFKTFKEEVSKKCDEWEKIPNKYIRSE